MRNELGIIILGTVILGLMGWGLRGFFADADIHLGIRVTVGAVGGGVLFLVVTLVRARLARDKSGKSKEVKK
ncbi:MAG: hypothetical protein JSU76_01085 [Dehalococcoidia bacterium]|nr:MAG: hypothetical protein JSU76_01085 [Dehalococcoidia bacterium]